MIKPNPASKALSQEYEIGFHNGYQQALNELDDKQFVKVTRCKDCRFRYTECCIVKDQPLMDTFYCWQGMPKDGDGSHIDFSLEVDEMYMGD